METVSMVVERLNVAESPEEILPDLLILFAVEMERLKGKLDQLEQHLQITYD